MKTTLGHILLWVGFLSGSLATVFATTIFARLEMTVTDQSIVVVDSVDEVQWTGVDLQPGDRIVEVAGKGIESLEDLEGERSFPLQLTVRRDHETVQITVPEPDQGNDLLEDSGIEFDSDNVVVADAVPEDSPGRQAGLRPGTEITQVGEDSVGSSGDFDKALGGYGKGTVPISFVADGRTESADVAIAGKWASVNWWWYLGSAALCIIGIVFLQQARRAGAEKSEKTQANLKQIKGYLADAVVNTEKMHNEIGEWSPRQILHFIEGELADDLREFAEGRNSITAEYGLDVFASVMSQFASGERAINRAWSAAADGYVEESARCVEQALIMLSAAEKELQSAE